MKINKKILNIPPYLSTPWTNVLSLYLQDEMLMISLNSGEVIAIPDLNDTQIRNLFSIHAKVMEEIEPNENTSSLEELFGKGAQIHFGVGNLESLGSALQHNPEHMHAPNLPKDVLKKVGSLAKLISPIDPDMIPKAEPHCNCVHCQIARAIREEEPKEEPYISTEDLKFQEWIVTQTEDALYTVTHKLDPQEKYSVFLGNPVGCTCGKTGCEHIVAVLRS